MSEEGRLPLLELPGGFVDDFVDGLCAAEAEPAVEADGPDVVGRDFEGCPGEALLRESTDGRGD
jgi:hypothetical protein